VIRLTEDKIACEPIFDSDISKSGLIHIPEVAQERCDQGIIKYVGPDVEDLQVGDYVLFSGYSGTLVELEDEGLLIILPEEFVTCILHPPGTDVAGLYFRDKEGNHFTATYEMCTRFMADAIRNTSWHRQLNVKSELLKRDDYERIK
jgi:co-chaperonin GroES (HSP10)